MHFFLPFRTIADGGLGHHRYPLVGSGDTYEAWETLAYEVTLSITAANVGVAWTHDLGAFMSNIKGTNNDFNGKIHDDPELYLRWLQYGKRPLVIYESHRLSHFCRLWPTYRGSRVSQARGARSFACTARTASRGCGNTPTLSCSSRPTASGTRWFPTSTQPPTPPPRPAYCWCTRSTTTGRRRSRPTLSPPTAVRLIRCR